MNNFIKLENSNLLVLVDINYGGKIVKLTNKENGSNWVWFNDKKYQNFLQLSIQIMIHNGLEDMKNYIQTIKLNLLMANMHLTMENYGHLPGK